MTKTVGSAATVLIHSVRRKVLGTTTERAISVCVSGIASETGYLAPGPQPSMPQQVEITIVSAASKT
jgi:hypothetical protein